MKKIAVVGLPVAAGLLAALYFSPHITLYNLRVAAEAGDAIGISDRVDFPAVRESLKASLTANITKNAAKDLEGNPLAGLGAMLAGAMASTMIEQLVTPEAIARMVLEGKARKAEGDETESFSTKPGEKLVKRYVGFDRFEARVELDNGERSVTTTLRRENMFFWKIKHIDINLGDS
jgi:hypothetical protein